MARASGRTCSLPVPLPSSVCSTALPSPLILCCCVRTDGRCGAIAAADRAAASVASRCGCVQPGGDIYTRTQSSVERAQAINGPCPSADAAYMDRIAYTRCGCRSSVRQRRRPSIAVRDLSPLLLHDTSDVQWREWLILVPSSPRASISGIAAASYYCCCIVLVSRSRARAQSFTRQRCRYRDGVSVKSAHTEVLTAAVQYIISIVNIQYDSCSFLQLLPLTY